MTLTKKIIVSLLIIAVIFIIKANVLKQPFFWDDMGGIASPALDMFDNNFRLIHPYRNFGHPPLLYISLAVIWKIFGYSIIFSHIFIILIGIVGLYYTFKIGNDFFNFWAGLGSTILLFFNQLFFAQIGIINDSIPLLTLGVMTVYFYLKNKKSLVFLFGSLLVLTKETGAILIFAIFIHWFVTELTGQKKLLKKIITLIKKSWFLVGPIGFLIAWFIFQKIQLGWFLRTDLILHQNDFWINLNKNFVRHFYYDFTNSNVNKFNFILLFFIVISAVKYKTKILKKYSLFFLIIFLYLILFSFTDDLPRYFTVILPFFYIVSANAIYSLCKRTRSTNIFFVSTIFLCSFLFTLNYQGNRQGPGFEIESNLEYSDFIYVSKQATDYIEDNYPNNPIITYWPMTDQLSEPRFGYVSQKISQIIDVTQNYRNYYVLNTSDTYNFDPTSIQITEDAIFYYNFPANNILKEITKNKDLEILQTFEKNNKSSIILKINNTYQQDNNIL